MIRRIARQLRRFADTFDPPHIHEFKPTDPPCRLLYCECGETRG